MLLLYAISLTLTGVIVISIYQAATSPLRSVPGPFLARFTRLWYLFRVAGGHFEAHNVALHRRYGPIVRVAPGMYSLDLPDAVGAVYGVGSRMPKSAWYEGWQHPSPERWSLFPDRSARRHAETRRRFQAMYSMTSLVAYEGYVDDCTDVLLQRLDELAQGGQAVDMMHWFQFYAFDVMGSITYSTRFGFMDHGEDVAGLLEALQSAMVYSTLVGVVPEIHPVLYRVMEWLGVGGAAGRGYLMKVVRMRVSERKEERAAAARADKTAPSTTSADARRPQSFLDKLLDQHEREPDKVTDYHIFMMGLSNIIAGSDTTAITLSAILYHLLRNPSCLARLRHEIDEMEAGATLGDSRHIRFQDAKDMPYLQAVIREAMRLHATTGLPLWRDVVDGGIVLGGRYFPERTTVGLNTWCAHYNESVFGEEAAEFRPDRWLVDEAKVKQMDAYYFPVSLYTCCFGCYFRISFRILRLVC